MACAIPIQVSGPTLSQGTEYQSILTILMWTQLSRYWEHRGVRWTHSLALWFNVCTETLGTDIRGSELPHRVI